MTAGREIKLVFKVVLVCSSVGVGGVLVGMGLRGESFAGWRGWVAVPTLPYGRKLICIVIRENHIRQFIVHRH